MRRIRDYNSAISRATEEVLTQGRVEGLAQIARHMLASGEPIDKIMRFTGLSKEDIERL